MENFTVKLTLHPKDGYHDIPPPSLRIILYNFKNVQKTQRPVRPYYHDTVSYLKSLSAILGGLIHTRNGTPGGRSADGEKIEGVHRDGRTRLMRGKGKVSEKEVAGAPIRAMAKWKRRSQLLRLLQPRSLLLEF